MKHGNYPTKRREERKMDVNAITTIISTVGFPIAMSIYMLYTLQKMNENHRTEIDNLRQAIENNTVAIVKLVEKLDKE